MSFDASLGARIRDEVVAPLRQEFVEKDEILDLLGVALLAGENVFLLGPPGTAKSALVERLASRLDGKTFEYLLTRFTEPNELFGPFDLRRLREGELATNTSGMLPEADFVFLDELLNANSAILNSLLSVLNERVLVRGRERFELPTLLVVGASNRLPEEESLAALFDRFLLRAQCGPVSTRNLESLLETGWRWERREWLDRAPISVATVREAQALVPRVDLTAVRSIFAEAIARIRHAGIEISDRRAVRLQRVIAASAMWCGREHAVRSDLWILRHVWQSENQIPVLESQVRATIGESDESGENAVSHPRAFASAPPNAGTIAEALRVLADEMERREGTVPARLEWRERLSLLSDRVEWITDDAEREVLRQRVDDAWKRLDEPRSR